ncbi:TPA: hypothetical protein P0E23_003804 [Vibrio harveyi]|nr:hypothetical protein [Vibrio parahaemolyticus]HDM8171164.1 hypothetical protein [Vibrio harveyi]
MSFGQGYLDKFNERFDEFRQIEHDIVMGKVSNGSASNKAFSLLYEIELCYAAGAYYACLILACSAIEASLSEQVPGNNLYQKLKNAGYEDESTWLRHLRNKLVHGTDAKEVYHFPEEDDKAAIIEQCKRAFKLVHALYCEPVKK